MASEVDICNLALSHISNDVVVSAIDPPDGSAEADHCARFYPVARDEILAMHAWGFATRRANLALLAENPVNHWAFAYAKPNDCIRELAVLLPESTDDTKTQDFAVEALADGSEVIYTNVEDAVLKFIVRVADTQKFRPLFASALSWLLAAYLAGPIVKDPKVMAEAYKAFIAQFGLATAADANAQQSDPYKGFTPSHIAARF